MKKPAKEKRITKAQASQAWELFNFYTKAAGGDAVACPMAVWSSAYRAAQLSPELVKMLRGAFAAGAKAGALARKELTK